MNVYNLSDHGPYNVLLTGDADFVADFAGVLQCANIQYNIIAPLDDLEEIDVDFDVLREPLPDAGVDPFDRFSGRNRGVNLISSFYRCHSMSNC